MKISDLKRTNPKTRRIKNFDVAGKLVSTFRVDILFNGEVTISARKKPQVNEVIEVDGKSYVIVATPSQGRSPWRCTVWGISYP
jgi:hypothetical protein